MASPAVNPPPPSIAGPMNKLSASMINSFRVAAVLERLSLHVVLDDPAGPQHPNGVEYYNLLLSLARGIDYAVANNDVLDNIQRLPELIKEICRRKSDACSQALVMVLLISVKNACIVGWFPEKEKQELLSLLNDVGSCFYNPRDVSSVTSDSLLAISTIFTKFYPHLKMSEILTSLEVKPGYWAFVNDFQISKNITHGPDDKLRLLVVQTDNTETSACLINPPRGNILINGKGVDQRTSDFVDTGPQNPSNVTPMLKYGTNLLQVVGEFSGHYAVVIAFIGITSQLDPSGLKDHVSSTISAPDPDSDLIEGPSRISLNCPISRSRIQLPVKGQSCKHPQCFDFSNFVGINSRRPSWRCPHCNQTIAYPDLRIDQDIAKVLKEVGSDITDVMISDDGSWKAVMESDDNPDIAVNKISNFSKEVPERQDPTGPPPVGNMLDLTGDDDQMDAVINIEDQDMKPLTNSKNTSLVNRDPVQPEDNFWSGVYEMATTSAAGLDPQVNGDGAFEPTMLSNLTSPALTDSISPALNNQDVHAFGSTSSLPTAQSQLSAANNLQLQQSQPNRHSVPMNVSRTAVAAQALPAHRQAPNTPQRPTNSVSPLMRNSSSTTSPVILPQTQQQFPRSLPTSPQPSFHQNQTLQGRPHSPAQLAQQAPNRSATPTQQQQPIQHQGLPRAYAGLFTGFHNTHLQRTLNNTMVPPQTSQSPNTPRYPLPRAQSPRVQTTSTSGALHSRMHIPPQQASPSNRQNVAPQIGISRPPGIRAPSPSEEQRRNNAAGVQPSPRGDESGDMASEQNWRPTGRMRGSLTGRAFTNDISQLVIQPTQPTRPSGPLAPSNAVNPSLSAPPHLRASMPNSKPTTTTGNTQNMQ